MLNTTLPALDALQVIMADSAAAAAAAAAESRQEQARALAQIVSQFQLDKKQFGQSAIRLVVVEEFSSSLF